MSFEILNSPLIKKRRYLLMAAFLLLSVFGLTVAVFANQHLPIQSSSMVKEEMLPKPSIVKKQIDIAYETNFWSRRINEIGAEASYEELKASYINNPYIDQHLLAHIFGYVLYAKKGLEGFPVCDDTFSSGCYHGFFERVFSDYNIDVIKKLTDSCVKRFGPEKSACQHGIGHGLMAFLGRDKLVEALRYCELTGQTNGLHGCSAGVFMEYNISAHFSKNNGKRDIRPLDLGNPLKPCNTITPEKDRPSCYYEIGQWWKAVFQEDYVKMGKLCEQISSNEKQKQSCFMGVGRVIVPATYFDPKLTIQLCSTMPSTEGESYCRISATQIFMGDPTASKKAPEVCQNSIEEKEKFCIDESGIYKK